MLPKLLVTHEIFKDLSSDSKILYSCLLNRNELSNKNGWIDEKGRVYTIFTIEEIMEVLNKSNKTSVKILNELEKIGLIKRKRQGLGKRNYIYVMDFMTAFKEECNNYTLDVKNLHSRNVETTLQEVKEVQRTNTNNKYINSKDNDFNKGKKTYGIFKNIFLTDDEIRELKEMIGSRLDEYIDRISSYMKSNNREYDDHKATIINWYLNDNSKNIKKINAPKKDEYLKGESL